MAQDLSRSIFPQLPIVPVPALPEVAEIHAEVDLLGYYSLHPHPLRLMAMQNSIDAWWEPALYCRACRTLTAPVATAPSEGEVVFLGEFRDDVIRSRDVFLFLLLLAFWIWFCVEVAKDWGVRP
jgi:hypothetical protein